MKSSILSALLAISLFVAYAQAGCDDPVKDSEEGDVSTWFKNVGCGIKKGAIDLKDAVKPLGETISSKAKDFGHTVAEKYDELKHKLTDDETNSNNKNGNVGDAHVLSSPTEKVPLAPLHGEGPHAAAAAA